MEFGVESGSQIVLDKLDKSIKLDDVCRMAKYASSIGLSVICTFIVGHYCDTPETMQQTVTLIRKMTESYQIKPLFSFNTLFPGTYQAQHSQQLGLNLQQNKLELIDPNVPNIEGQHFTAEDLRQFYFDVADWVDQAFPI